MRLISRLLVVIIFVQVQQPCNVQRLRRPRICSSTVTMVNRCHGPLSDVIFKNGLTSRCSSTAISPGMYALLYDCDTTQSPVFALKNGCQKVQITDFHASQVHSMTCLEPTGDGCTNGGTCKQASNHTYSWECPSGFSGQHCEINVDDCSSGPCLNNGTCVDGFNKFSCTCIPGYTGDICDTNANDCTSSSCHNNGTCVDGVNNYTCTCPAGYSGPHCEINIDDCVSGPCQNNGHCVDGVNGLSCICMPGYSGDICETNDDPCASVTCQNGGKCVRSGDAASCNCSQDFRGPLCENDCWDKNVDMVYPSAALKPCSLGRIFGPYTPVGICHALCIEYDTCDSILYRNGCTLLISCNTTLEVAMYGDYMEFYKCRT